MFRRRQSLEAIVVAVAILVAGLTAEAGQDQSNPQDERRQSVAFGDARLKIETNDTDGDAGVQVFLDSDPWQWVEIYDPKGRKLFRSTAHGIFAKQGGTELFLESGEPSFDEVSFERFLARFPAGEYRFVGKGTEGERFLGAARLSHNIPDGPLLVGPHEGGALVDPESAVVEWEPVAAPNGSPIIAYQVLVVLGDTGLAALPKITLDVMMPATASSLAVPPGFLRRNTLYEWEVLAIEQSGNQTLSSSFFRTAP